MAVGIRTTLNTKVRDEAGRYAALLHSTTGCGLDGGGSSEDGEDDRGQLHDDELCVVEQVGETRERHRCRNGERKSVLREMDSCEYARRRKKEKFQLSRESKVSD